jgi:hypothetical protein
MAAMLTTAFDIVFAIAVVVAAGTLAAGIFRLASRRALELVVALLTGAALAAWVLFAVRHDRDLALDAAGLTACVAAAAGSLLLARALARAEAMDEHLAEAKGQLAELVRVESAKRVVELERTLVRARADSISLLNEEERRIAEERRQEFADRERELTRSLLETLNTTQAQVELRLAGWAQDLERAAEGAKGRIAELTRRQKHLLSEVEQRLATDAERLASESESQRAGLARLRSEVEKSVEEALAAAGSEVDSHAAERRRALHELDERMRRRERELLERMEREESDAVQRIRAGFEDAERRQLEQMQRIVERAAARYSEEAGQQFAALVKSGREDAARRLSRELDRAVEVFAREAEAVLAERLSHVGDAGAQRLERRLAEAASSLERQRDDWMTAFESRISGLEADVRRRLTELGSDAEAERAVLEARLQELARRVEAAAGVRSGR